MAAWVQPLAGVNLVRTLVNWRNGLMKLKKNRCNPELPDCPGFDHWEVVEGSERASQIFSCHLSLKHNTDMKDVEEGGTHNILECKTCLMPLF